jgi:hypothetical protein
MRIGGTEAHLARLSRTTNRPDTELALGIESTRSVLIPVRRQRRTAQCILQSRVGPMTIAPNRPDAIIGSRERGDPRDDPIVDRQRRGNSAYRAHAKAFGVSNVARVQLVDRPRSR